ncbi:MAG: sialidase family protein [Acidimicrobiales bacterium]
MTLEQQLRDYYNSDPITLNELRHRMHSGADLIDFEPVDTDNMTLDDLDTPTAHDAGSLPGRKPALARNPGWLYAAAVMLILVGVVAVVQRSTSPETAAVGSADPAAAGRWVQIDQGDAFDPAPSVTPDVLVQPIKQNRIFVTAVRSTALGYFAIGAEQRDQASTGAVWRSADGQTWTRVADPDHLWGDVESRPVGYTRPLAAGLWTIAEHDGTVVIGGYRYRDPASTSITAAAWSTTDGINWTAGRMPGDSAGRSVRSIVGTEDGFLAISGGAAAPVGPQLWRSVDGVTWLQVHSEGFPDDAVVSSMTTTDTGTSERIVAVGSAGSLNQRPGLWYSDDNGNTWRSGTIDHRPSDHPFGELTDVQTGPNGLIGLGIRQDQSATTDQLDGSYQLVVWESSDGIAWDERPIDATENRPWMWPGLAVGPDGFVVAAFIEVDDGYEGVSWISADGGPVERLEHPTGRAGGVPAATSDGYVTITPVLATNKPGPVPPVAEPTEVWTLSTVRN